MRATPARAGFAAATARRDCGTCQPTTRRLDWTRCQGAAPFRSLAFSPDGDLVVSRSASDRVGLWAAQTSYSSS